MISSKGCHYKQELKPTEAALSITTPEPVAEIALPTPLPVQSTPTPDAPPTPEDINSILNPVAEIAHRLNNELSANELIERLTTAPATYNRLIELWYQKPESVVFRIDLTSNDGPTLSACLAGEHIKIDELLVTPDTSWN